MAWRTPVLRPWLRRAGPVLSLGFVLAACATPSVTRGVPPSPNARLYAYLMAHGMARGAVMSGEAGRRDVSAIAAADHAAQRAVMASLQHRSPENDTRADAAIAALLGDLPP